jgi:hypothetical protein
VAKISSVSRIHHPDTNQSAGTRPLLLCEHNTRCTNTGEVCTSSSECEDTSGFFGACLPGWIEINLDVFLTPSQPLAWSASDGFPSGSKKLPCPASAIVLSFDW